MHCSCIWTPDWGSLVGLLPEYQDQAPPNSLHFHLCDRWLRAGYACRVHDQVDMHVVHDQADAHVVHDHTILHDARAQSSLYRHKHFVH